MLPRAEVVEFDIVTDPVDGDFSARSATGRVRTSRAPTEADLMVSRRIFRLRRASGISQREMSAKIGITSPQMYRYENGLARISTGRLLRIANALNVEMGALLYDVVPPRKEGEESEHCPDLASLIDAYRFIQSPEHRAALLNLARSLSRGEAVGT